MSIQMKQIKAIMARWLARCSVLSAGYVISLCLVSGTTLGADEKAGIVGYLDAYYDQGSALAMQVWDLAEVGYLEQQSSQLLQAELGAAGFEVAAGVAGIPTAFVASYGQGRPIIGILAEFDALPGISQAAEPVRKILEGKPNGHACGHHLFGVGSVAAALAVKDWLEKTGATGTIRLYGTPAEEGGSGKVYMVRGGLFADVDAVLHWHPSDSNNASPATSLANKSARFQFSGISSHASGAPEKGRSALDGVESMNFMANMMREHMPIEARLHYVITHGGSAPNVVPDFAEVYYYVRHPEASELDKIFNRLVKISEGAALGTGTTVSHEVMHGNHSLLPNDQLASIMDQNLRYVGGIKYNQEEQRFAGKISESFSDQQPKLPADQIKPFRLLVGKGSTDVGDISWVVPTTGLRAATWVPGTSSHSWQAIAAGGTSIGTKGMQVAAKTIALTAVDLFNDPSLALEAKLELDKRRGSDYQYAPLLGDRDPPLDYRK
jgi:aminobenzoyl-glutamate utilization protein B